MKIHILAAVVALAASLILNINYIEWILVILCIIMVWAAEIGNTVVEKYMDTYHPERSQEVGAIKDMSAAAVLVLSLGAAIIGCIIFIPKLIQVL